MPNLVHLEDLTALEQALAASGDKTVMIFKHSAT